MMNKAEWRYSGGVYALGGVVALLAIVWAELEIWDGVNELRGRAEAVSADGLHLSDHLEARMRALNDLVFRESLQASEGGKMAIEREAGVLRRWLSEHREKALTPRHRKILGDAEAVFKRYWEHIRSGTGGEDGGFSGWRREKDEILEAMWGVTRELSGAEKDALEEFTEQTQRSMRSLQGKLMISSLVMMAMGAGMGYLGFRGVIVPLRSRLRQSQDVIQRQEKLSSLGVLAAGVAHEIRNPLTSIKARLFTQQGWLEGRSEAMEDNVFITEEISRLEKIVADFLAFARPSDPRRARIRVTQLIRELEGLWGAGLSKAGIELKKEILADPEIWADPGQIKQVLINLAQNAAESMSGGRGGVITLRTRTQKRHRATHPEMAVVVEVQDTGPGIPPEVRKRLFDPFFTTKASGTGLGLSIAARILEKHGGTLEYETGMDWGTTFRLVLPMAAEEA